MGKLNKSLAAVLIGMAFVLFAAPLFSQEADNSAQTAQSSVDLERSIVFDDAPEASSADQGAPGRSGRTSSGIGIFVRMIVVLVIIVLLIYGVFWFIKKKANVVTNDDDYLRRVASISVAPGKTVQVVTLIDKAYLIGVTDDTISLLGEINDDELIKAMNLNADKKANVKKPATFSDVLDMFLVKNGRQKSVFSESEQKVDNLFSSENTEGGRT